jgi:hypothetical protein
MNAERGREIKKLDKISSPAGILHSAVSLSLAALLKE